MSTKKVVRKAANSGSASQILRTVSTNEAFRFFTVIGQDSGISATSLADFSEKIKSVPLQSTEFHFKRGDFEWWIRDTLRDEYLANKIGRIDKSIQGEALRSEIQGIVRNRLSYLMQPKQ